MDTRLDVASRLLAGLAANPNSTLDNTTIAWSVKLADKLIAQVRDTGPAADEIDRLRKALVEAGRCVVCDDGIYTVHDTVAKDGEWVEVVAGTEVCPNCDGTTIPADLSPSTQAAVKAAKEAIDG